MYYCKLFGLCFIAVLVGYLADLLIYWFIQILNKLRGGYNINAERLFINLFLPLVIIILFIFFYIFI